MEGIAKTIAKCTFGSEEEDDPVTSLRKETLCRNKGKRDAIKLCRNRQHNESESVCPKKSESKRQNL